jgi:serine/threonine protein kinase
MEVENTESRPLSACWLYYQLPSFSTMTESRETGSLADSHGASKWWASPEQMLMAPCTSAADVFGLGSVIWELCTGLPIQSRCLRPLKVPEEAPQEIDDLISACRANSSRDRPTAAEVHAIIVAAARRAEQ